MSRSTKLGSGLGSYTLKLGRLAILVFALSLAVTASAHFGYTGQTVVTVKRAQDMGLVAAGLGLTTRANAIETPTQCKRRKDQMKGKLEPLVRFGIFEVFSEQEWQAAKGA